ncbi:MAG: acyl transferase [Bacteroidota bacterium]
MPSPFADPFASDLDFDAAAAQLWDYQRAQNPIVRRFCELLGTESPTFMPISFFKEHDFRTGGDWTPEIEFQSSGTTGQIPSRHRIREAALYRKTALRGFRQFYGPGNWSIFALLPHYLERGHSSLVWMVKTWMEDFGNLGSDFYLHDRDRLRRALQSAAKSGDRILLIGVTYALLDLAEEGKLDLPDNAVVMETGGMKGRRKEMIRAELHTILRDGLGVGAIHSEYGMTELLSQAYLTPEPGATYARFRCPPWMRVTITDPYLPGRVLPTGQTGRINVTDLANRHSCAFIRTDDLGRAFPDGSFEVLGRLDHAEMRGCNLMYS